MSGVAGDAVGVVGDLAGRLLAVGRLVHVRVVAEVLRGLRRRIVPAIRRGHCPAGVEQQRERKEERKDAGHEPDYGQGL